MRDKMPENVQALDMALNTIAMQAEHSDESRTAMVLLAGALKSLRQELQADIGQVIKAGHEMHQKIHRGGEGTNA